MNVQSTALCPALCTFIGGSGFLDAVSATIRLAVVRGCGEGDPVNVLSASFAYPDLDGAARAAVTERLADVRRPDGTFVLATCLRIEIATLAHVECNQKLVADLAEVAGQEPAVRTGGKAVTHLFRVAAGLESPVVGEVEIHTQFRAALADLKGHASVPGRLIKLLEGAVATGREARAVLESSPHDTMAALAAQVAGRAHTITVLGSGTMAAAIVAALAALPAPPTVTVLARSPEKVTIGGVTAGGLERLGVDLRTQDAVISATAATTKLLSDDGLASAVSERRGRLTLIDMAMPPDFGGVTGPFIEYIDIDDLAAMANRRIDTAAAEGLVEVRSGEAHRLMVSDEIGPSIARILAFGDSVVDDAVDKFGRRLLDSSDVDILRQAAHTVARTLLARPIARIRAGDGPIAETLADTFDR